MLAVEAAKVLRDLPRPGDRAATAVEEIPAENRRVVFIRDSGVDIDMFEERLDVLLDVSDDRLIRPERRHVDDGAIRDGDAPPTEVHTACSACARVIADDRRNDLDAVGTGGLERVVDPLERGLVEVPERRLDAAIASDRVTHRLASDDLDTHLPRRCHRVVDLVVAREVRAIRIERAISDQAEPFDVRATKTERPAGHGEPRPRPGDERVGELLESGQLRRGRGILESSDRSWGRRAGRSRGHDQ